MKKVLGSVLIAGAALFIPNIAVNASHAHHKHPKKIPEFSEYIENFRKDLESNLPKLKKGSHDYEHEELVDIYKETLKKCKGKYIDSTIYALNCHNCEVDDDVQLTVHYGHGQNRHAGKFFLNAKTSIKGVFDSIEENEQVDGTKVAIVNFANYFKGGGAVRTGGHAQEESLYRDTNLTKHVLHNKALYDAFYGRNNYLLNATKQITEIGDNRAIYSRNVTWIRDTYKEGTKYKSKVLNQDKQKHFDVITVAAPDFRNVTVRSHTNRMAILKDRIRLTFEAARRNHVTTLGFGAFGCGVYECDPTEVAQACKEVYNEGDYNFTVVFNIIDKNSDNYKAFKKVLFNKYKK